MGLDAAILESHRLAAATAGVTVRYWRGASSVQITDALVGRTEFSADLTPGIKETFESRDYLFPPARLVLAGLETLPRAGDTIEQTIRGTLETFRVIDLGPDPPYRRDATRNLLRVHTKRVS